jgi:hypothetical protein
VDATFLDGRLRDGVKVDNLENDRPSFAPKNIPSTYFCWRLSPVDLEGLGELENQMK